jgi:hypothetical protein
VDKVEDLMDFFTEAKWLANFPGIVKMIENAKMDEKAKPRRKIRVN